MNEKVSEHNESFYNFSHFLAGVDYKASFNISLIT